MGRLEDADRHVGQLNTLYLSTIETLAMAIDAKDQVTHGHIRRVQNRAVFLARRVGVRDESQIKAIEAAALLHDTGQARRSGVHPEQAGKTDSGGVRKDETSCQRRRRHSFGDRLSLPSRADRSPPSRELGWVGLSDAACPEPRFRLARRILAVVDCFDALTSDRPYRPRLSDDDALEFCLNDAARCTIR